jgi:D-sedoheptulose 7-phosphate isomerase
MEYCEQYLKEAAEILHRIDQRQIHQIVELISELQTSRGRLFCLGVGGSAANCSHAVNDFRKICGIEAYAPTENVSELTARTNDDGWETVFSTWLAVSKLNSQDILFVLSVGGGDLERKISPNLVRALQYGQSVGSRIVGIVGRDGGYTGEVADVCVLIPTINPETVTPHSEAFQAVIWHLIVSHPRLRRQTTKWESIR